MVKSTPVKVCGKVLEEVISKNGESHPRVAFFIAGWSTKQGTIEEPGTFQRKVLGFIPRCARLPGRTIHLSLVDSKYP